MYSESLDMAKTITRANKHISSKSERVYKHVHSVKALERKSHENIYLSQRIWQTRRQSALNARKRDRESLFLYDESLYVMFLLLFLRLWSVTLHFHISVDPKTN